jgi:cysteine desulfurase
MIDFGIIFAIIISTIILVIWYVRHRADSEVPNIFAKYEYFDNNGTTQPAPGVYQTMTEYSRVGNASSDYATAGRLVLDVARFNVREWLKSPYETDVIFTSGASESNNLFIRGVIDGFWSRHPESAARPHLIISAIEHKTSIDCARALAQLGRVELTIIEARVDGTIDPIEIGYAIRPETVAISVMHVNNETGAVNDIESIAEIALRARKLFHCDAVQSFGKWPGLMSHPGVSAISASFHKIYGPTGVGLLALASGAAKLIAPQINGSQNDGMRGGTDNVPGVAGSLRAMQFAFADRDRKNLLLRAMKQYIVGRLATRFRVGNFNDYVGRDDEYSPLGGHSVQRIGARGEIVFLGPVNHAGLPDHERASPNTIMVSFVKFGPLADHFCNIALKRALFEQGVVISIGSACNTGSTAPSHVLASMKAPFVIRCGVIRISLGDFNTLPQCAKFCDLLFKLVEIDL